MKTTEITKDGVVSVVETSAAVKVDGADFIGVTTRTIQPGQIEKHMCMVGDDMNASQKTKATQVIAAQKALEAVKVD